MESGYENGFIDRNHFGFEIGHENGFIDGNDFGFENGHENPLFTYVICMYVFRIVAMAVRRRWELANGNGGGLSDCGF